MTPDRHLGAAWIDKCRPDLLITESTYATTIRDSKRCRERDFLKKVHDCVEKGGKVWYIVKQYIFSYTSLVNFKLQSTFIKLKGGLIVNLPKIDLGPPPPMANTTILQSTPSPLHPPNGKMFTIHALFGMDNTKHLFSCSFCWVFFSVVFFHLICTPDEKNINFIIRLYWKYQCNMH